MTVEDAKAAIGFSDDALWISNNGGRGLDTLPSGISVIQSIRSAVGDKIEIYIDGGIRRGTDVAKCLALGANLCIMGRPVAWGLNFGGKEGVEQLVSTIHEEFKTVMVLTNSMEIAQITPKQIIHEL